MFNTTLELLRTLVAGAAALDVEVLVTTGRTVDPTALGPQPDHVHAAQFVPQDQVLDAVDAVICHAGSVRSAAPCRSGCRWWWHP